MVEQKTLNLLVPGSSPGRGTTFPPIAHKGLRLFRITAGDRSGRAKRAPNRPQTPPGLATHWQRSFGPDPTTGAICNCWLTKTGHSGQFSGVAGILLRWTNESPGKGRPRAVPDPVKGHPHDEAPPESILWRILPPTKGRIFYGARLGPAADRTDET